MAEDRWPTGGPVTISGVLLLIPSDPHAPRRADEHFAPEASAAVELGLEVAFIDHDALCAGVAEAAVRRVSFEGEALYRGWMVRPEEYSALAGALAVRQVGLMSPTRAAPCPRITPPRPTTTVPASRRQQPDGSTVRKCVGGPSTPSRRRSPGAPDAT